MLSCTPHILHSIPGVLKTSKGFMKIIHSACRLPHRVEGIGTHGPADLNNKLAQTAPHLKCKQGSSVFIISIIIVTAATEAGVCATAACPSGRSFAANSWSVSITRCKKGDQNKLGKLNVQDCLETRSCDVFTLTRPAILFATTSGNFSCGIILVNIRSGRSRVYHQNTALLCVIIEMETALKLVSALLYQDIKTSNLPPRMLASTDLTRAGRTDVTPNEASLYFFDHGPLFLGL